MEVNNTMAMKRRDFLKKGLLATGGSVFLGQISFNRIAYASAGGLYWPNKAPLQAAAFYRLPVGSVKAQGWLAGQLQLQLAGLCGQYNHISHFLNYNTTGWITPNLVGWEEVPYWLRGYGDLAYVTGDATALSTTQQWINGIIATQQSDGFFGPTSLRTSLNGGPDFWPFMPLLRAFCSFQEYFNDTRIVPFLTRFFQYMNAQANSVFSQGWAYTRWGDTLDTIYWLYNRTGDAWLLDLVTKIHQNSANWMSSVLPTLHNVNLSQGFREPALFGILEGGAQYNAAVYQNYATIMNTYGQFSGGGFAGDENARPGFGDPRQGFETCGIVEYMQSDEILVRITGDPVWADRTENLAFNSLPAALDPQGKALHYITSANSIQLDDVAKSQGQFDNGWAMQAYLQGVDQYRCCPHNYGMGWPFFTEESWLATPDNGLCATLYAPTTVTANVGNGTTVTFTETTNYPFSDTITLKLSTPSTLAFPLYLRIPGWCASPVLQVNGQNVAAQGGPVFAKINRTWANGDTVTLQLPMQTSVQTWTNNHNSVSANYGPLTFSLQIAENYTLINNSTAQIPEYEVTARSPWNYGLVLNGNNPAQSFTVQQSGGTLAANPFTQQTVPITMQVQAQQITGWQADSQNVVTTLQASPTLSSVAAQAITLIPMGAARLRISSFPTIGTGAGETAWVSAGVHFRIQNQNSGKVLAVTNESTADSALVVQYDDNGTPDHLWSLINNGDGYFRIQNLNSSKVLGVTNMSTADSANVVQYDDNGTADHLWKFIDTGDGYVHIQNQNSGLLLAVQNASTADSANVQQYHDNGTPDHLWRFIPDGYIHIQNQNSGLLLAVQNASTADNANIQQYHDNGTPDHLWQFIPDANGYFRIQNQNSGKVLAVSGASTADSVQIVQYDDNGTNDHLWRLLYGGGDYFRIQNLNSGKVLGVTNMSTADSANVVQYDDNGTADHLWQFS
jgi:hypothetical protein